MKQKRVDDYDCTPSHERPASDPWKQEARDSAGRLFRIGDRVRHIAFSDARVGEIRSLSVYPASPCEIYKIQVQWPNAFGSHWPENLRHESIVHEIGSLE